MNMITVSTKVIKYVEKDMYDRKYRLLWIDNGEKGDICISVPRKAQIPDKLRKGDKVILRLELVKARRNGVRVWVRQIEKLGKESSVWDAFVNTFFTVD